MGPPLTTEPVVYARRNSQSTTAITTATTMIVPMTPIPSAAIT
jgi:hypothetical protein